MEDPKVESALAGAEARLSAGEGLAGSGFWGAVSKVKKDPGLIEAYADRIATIDDKAFRRWAVLVIPVWIGTALALGATSLGLVLVALAYRFDGWGAIVTFGAGFGVILVATHGLAHLLVGRLVGMRFTAWFVGTIRSPQPGVKIDYSTYLRTPARSRAWMHASGAIVTKIIPFAMIGAAVAAGLPTWVPWGLAALGVGQLVTDALWSTAASDWKKFRREMAYDE